tara:strand:- start:116 stop:622 length:507 start_codon:yes stop_codon:yes gene_type:complete
MSRAFVKEDDLEHAGIDIPERPISSAANYVTPFGYIELEKKIIELESMRLSYIDSVDVNLIQKKMRVERDLRYFASRLNSAILIDPDKQPKDTILFSAKVDVLTESEENLTFEIVGEDESDIQKNKISYTSPLAKSLIGQRTNEEVIWKKPSGDTILLVTKIYYESNK